MALAPLSKARETAVFSQWQAHQSQDGLKDYNALAVLLEREQWKNQPRDFYMKVVAQYQSALLSELDNRPIIIAPTRGRPSLAHTAGRVVRAPGAAAPPTDAGTVVAAVAPVTAVTAVTALAPPSPAASSTVDPVKLRLCGGCNLFVDHNRSTCPKAACKNCNEKGHIARDCTKEKKKKKEAASSAASSDAAEEEVEDAEDYEDDEATTADEEEEKNEDDDEDDDDVDDNKSVKSSKSTKSSVKFSGATSSKDVPKAKAKGAKGAKKGKAASKVGAKRKRVQDSDDEEDVKPKKGKKGKKEEVIVIDDEDEGDQ